MFLPVQPSPAPRTRCTRPAAPPTPPTATGATAPASCTCLPLPPVPPGPQVEGTGARPTIPLLPQGPAGRRPRHRRLLLSGGHDAFQREQQRLRARRLPPYVPPRAWGWRAWGPGGVRVCLRPKRLLSETRASCACWSRGLPWRRGPWLPGSDLNLCPCRVPGAPRGARGGECGPWGRASSQCQRLRAGPVRGHSVPAGRGALGECGCWPGPSSRGPLGLAKR